jgi:hypothetical protein
MVFAVAMNEMAAAHFEAIEGALWVLASMKAMCGVCNIERRSSSLRSSGIKLSKRAMAANSARPWRNNQRKPL